MTKVLKLLGKFCGFLLDWSLITIILFVFFIRTSFFQTYLAGLASAYFSKEWNTEVHIGKVDIHLIDKVELKDVLLNDQKGNAIVKVDRLIATISKIDIDNLAFTVGKVGLEKGYSTLNINERGESNLQFLIDYFSSDAPSEPGKPFFLDVNAVEFANLNFKFDDFRSKPMTNGLDYSHLDIKNLFLTASDFAFHDNEISVFVEHLKLKEKSGLNIQRLTAHAKVGTGGILLGKLRLKTPETLLEASKLNLRAKNLDAFSNFIEDVNFDIELKKSTVSLRDVALFVPELHGMDQQVILAASIHNPLTGLEISDLDFSTGMLTQIQGSLKLPDVRQFDSQPMKVNLWRAYLNLNDIEKLHLPDGNAPLVFDELVHRFDHAFIADLQFIGTPSSMKFKVDSLKTAIGAINIPNFVRLDLKETEITWRSEEPAQTMVNLIDVQLGTILEDPTFGNVTAELFADGGLKNGSDVFIHSAIAAVKSFQYQGYRYSNIHLDRASIENNLLDAELKIKDPNLDLDFSGKIGWGTKQLYDVDIELNKANLGVLNFTNEKETSLSTSITADLNGTNFNDLSGSIKNNFLQYREKGDELNIPTLNVTFERSLEKEKFILNSSILNAKLEGKIDYESVLANFMEDLAAVFPSLIPAEKKTIDRKNSQFKLELTTGNLDEFLAIFIPKLKIDKATKFDAIYNSMSRNLSVELNSSGFKFEDVALKSINVVQKLESGLVNGTYSIEKMRYGDSLAFNGIEFITTGDKSNLDSKLSWEPNTSDFSTLEWDTHIFSSSKIQFELLPSFFTLGGFRWEIEKQSEIKLDGEELSVKDFKLVRGRQNIRMNGKVSDKATDKIKLDIHNFDLAELDKMLGLGLDLKGTFGGWATFATPFTVLSYQGDAYVDNLFLGDKEVGNLNIQSDWNAQRESVIVGGELHYRTYKTLGFGGRYQINTDDMNFFVNFDKTDLGFTNAFMDPTVVGDIGGNLKGTVFITGKTAQPILKGKLSLENGSALVGLTGVKYKMDGVVKIEEDAFLINNMPVKDEEGNTASLVGQVYHSNFKNWNFDMQFDFENDFSKKIGRDGRAVPLEKFMVQNTKYKDGDMYFGKAYAVGTANISGNQNNLDVTVEVETKKGTEINFPMYGVSEMDENVDFVKFVEKGVQKKIEEQKIDFTGVNLDMKFKVNNDAQLKIIFNEQTGDEITAKGNGVIEMRLDQLNHVTMAGDFYISKGSQYNFVMGVIKQKFDIQEGSKISWTGDPINAAIDIKTSIPLKKVSLLDLSPEQIDASLTNQEVLCYLNLTESLMNPAIKFDIDAPKAPETGKALINRVKSDPDELNKQFFSLLLVRKFQPLKGSITAGSSAAVDLITSQINDALGKVSEKYKLNVAYGADEKHKENSVEVGVKTGFLEDRLIVSGSFGVENRGTSTTGTSTATTSNKQSSALMDLSVEYLINEKGTFRVNAFNRSNTNSVNENAGPFTQGAGLSYREDFNSFRDFELLQYTLDVFRKSEKKKYPIKKKKQLSKVPPVSTKPEEKVTPQPKKN